MNKGQRSQESFRVTKLGSGSVRVQLQSLYLLRSSFPSPPSSLSGKHWRTTPDCWGGKGPGRRGCSVSFEFNGAAQERWSPLGSKQLTSPLSPPQSLTSTPAHLPARYPGLAEPGTGQRGVAQWLRARGLAGCLGVDPSPPS